MPSDRPNSPGARRRFERVLGDLRGTTPGPSLVFIAGLYGNEPGGALAAEQVAATLRERGTPLRGRVVFLAGNVQALASGLRFVRRDLNRGWTEPELSRVRALPEHALGDEDQEQRDLAECLYAIERERRGRLIVIDLHTTSAESAPFISFGDTLLNRRLALALPVTAILVSRRWWTAHCQATGRIAGTSRCRSKQDSTRRRSPWSATLPRSGCCWWQPAAFGRAMFPSSRSTRRV